MRCFVLICVLATAAYGDVSHLGYTYQQGHGGHGGHGGHSVSSFSDGSSGFSSGGSASFGSANLGGQIGGGSAGFSGGSIGGGSSGFSAGSIGGGSSGFSSGSIGGGSSGFGAGSIGGGSSGFGAGSGFTSGGHSHHHQQHRVEESPAEVEFVKEFYTFDAPQEEYHEDESVQRVKESIKKNLQVVFIKTPETRGIEHAALSLAKSASETNTAIYILQKQPDVSEFSNQLNLIHTHNAHKPEVHFVKYRTPEEAAHAQHTIQSQYESLGGSTVHKHGGVPEILNYASNYAPGFGSHQVVNGGSQHTVSGGHQTYHTGAIVAPSAGGHQTYHTGAIIAPSSGAHHDSSSTVVSTGDAPSQTYLPANA